MLNLDPEVNPLSFPILGHVTQSPAIIHALQNLSVVHKGHFTQQSLLECLDERNHALAMLRKELEGEKKPLVTSFMTVFLLGVATSWIDALGGLSDYGRDHLRGAAAILGLILRDERYKNDLKTQEVVGYYLYWDMSCAFLGEPEDIPPLDLPELRIVVQQMRDSFHPMSGFSTGIFYLLSTLGRYCRRLLNGHGKDDQLEADIEQQLLQWQSCRLANDKLSLITNAYRLHGLIMLYRICGRVNSQIRQDQDEIDQLLDRAEMETQIRVYALGIIQSLAEIPVTSPMFMSHGMPLLTAGSELTADDALLRQEVVYRFRAMFSYTRVPTCLRSVELLEQYWLIRDRGIEMSYLDCMFQKNWRLSLV